MSDDFAIPADLEVAHGPATSPPAALEATPVAVPPLVVIEYRNRGIRPWLLIPVPALMLALVLWSSGQWVTSPVRLPQNAVVPGKPALVAWGVPGRETGSAPRAVESGPDRPSDAPSAERVVTGAEPRAHAPAHPPSGTPIAMPSEQRGEDDRARRDEPPLPTDPDFADSNVALAGAPRVPGRAPAGEGDESAPAPAVVAPADQTPPTARGPEPMPPAAVSVEEVERAIGHEAEQREAELDLMRQAKVDAAESRRLANARHAYEERVVFRNALRAILRAGGATAGQQIGALCDRSGSDVPPEQRTAVARRARSLPERSTHADRVALLRAHDIPEPIILDELSRSLARHLLNARGGARNADDVRVHAARQLLAVPLPPQARSDRPRSD